MKKGKIIVVSAPSGCGKSTIIKAILDKGEVETEFSVSATNRAPRPGEVDGVHYRFLSTEEFKEAVNRGDFVEWEEVYPGRFYGTLRSEIDRKIDEGHNVLLDIDVKGALNVKRIYGDLCKTIFIKPPSVEELRRRLVTRGTETPEVIDTRVGRADYEISLAPDFDVTVVNDNLDTAVNVTENIFKNFLNN